MDAPELTDLIADYREQGFVVLGEGPVTCPAGPGLTAADRFAGLDARQVRADDVLLESEARWVWLRDLFPGRRLM